MGRTYATLEALKPNWLSEETRNIS